MGFQSKNIFILPSCKLSEKYALHIVIMSILVFAASGCSRFGGGGDPVKNMRSVQRQVITKQLPAHGVRTIKLSENYGSIEIEFNSDEAVTIAATRVIKAKTDMESRRRLVDMNVNIKRRGNALVVATSYPDGFYKKYHGRVNYSVTAPMGMDVDVVDDAGIVTVEAGAGSVSVRTKSGHVRVSEPSGAVDIATKSGDIRFVTPSAPERNTKISSIKGDVTAIIPAESNALIFADFPPGKGVVSLPITNIKETSDSVSGTMNKGGVRIAVKSKKGNVLVAPYKNGK